MENSFLAQAQQGRNQWWRFALTFLFMLTAAALTGALIAKVLMPALGRLFRGAAERELLLYGLMTLLFGSLLLGLTVGVRMLHRRPLASLLGRFRWLDYLKGMMLWGGLLTGSILLTDYGAVVTFLKDFHPGAGLAKAAALLVFVGVQTATEELIFRGYLLPALARPLRPLGWPIVISSLVFGLLHLGYGYQAFISAVLFGAVFALISLRRQGLGLAIGAHFINNFLIMMVLENGADLSSPSAFDTHIDFTELGLSCLSFAVLLAVAGKWRRPSQPAAALTSETVQTLALAA